jgi:hypothetical protein
MVIEDYSFGKIRIDGKTYTHDVIIYPDHVHSPWWRAEGHVLAIEDLAGILDNPPRVLVIGNGYLGRMAVPSDTLAALQARGIEVRIHKTKEAVDEYNRLSRESGDVVAALHLTC